jgi:hypothetical protein
MSWSIGEQLAGIKKIDRCSKRLEHCGNITESVCLSFDDGQLVFVAACTDESAIGKAALSEDDLLLLVMGQCALSTLQKQSPDIRVNKVARCLLKQLFPPERSAIAATG